MNKHSRFHLDLPVIDPSGCHLIAYTHVHGTLLEGRAFAVSVAQVCDQSVACRNKISRRNAGYVPSRAYGLGLGHADFQALFRVVLDQKSMHGLAQGVGKGASVKGVAEDDVHCVSCG